MQISVRQINQSELALFAQQASSGAAFSGNMVAYFAGSGWVGNTVVHATGGAQLISGDKTFTSSPGVPYVGATGAAPSAKYVNDQDISLSGAITGQFTYIVTGASGSLTTSDATISGILNTKITALSGFTTAASGQLSAVRVTGSSTLPIAHLTGLGGTLVIVSGGFIFVSGAAAGGGSNTQVTGSAAISAPNFTGVGNVTLTYDGTYVKVSGTAGADATLSGYVEATFVHRTAIDETVLGIKTFTGNPQIPAPTLPSGAANLSFVSGVSGVLVTRDLDISGVLQTQINAGGGNTYHITGTGVVSVYSNASGNITNTFNITSGNVNVTSTGTTTNTYNVSGGTLNNNFNLSGITGNFVNMSFYYDSTTLATGFNNAEAFVGRSFFFTGYALGVINTGTQGMFSGSLYQRTPNNVKTNFINFSLRSGMFFSGVGGFAQEISGLNRVGLDIYLIGTGITGLSIGVFGVGY